MRDSGAGRSAGTDSAQDEQGLSAVLESMRDLGQGDDVSVDQVLGELEGRSIGPLLLVPSFLALIPLIGAIPGISILTGTIILLISVQFFLPQRHLWVPRRLRRLSIGRDTLAKGIDKSLPAVRRIEGVLSPRLTALARKPLNVGVPVACILMAVLMYPAAFLPWAVTAPAAAIFLFAAGLTMRDGLVILLGYLVSAGSIFLLWTLLW
ncbi:MAG: exopolysaccharide biosynthesis protein [Azospirillaceae bacterium]